MSDPIQDIARQLGITTFGDGLLVKIRESIDGLRDEMYQGAQYKEVLAETQAKLAKQAQMIEWQELEWKSARAQLNLAMKVRDRAYAELSAIKANAAVPVAYLVEGLGTVSLQYKHLPTWAENDESLTVTPLYTASLAQPQSDAVIVPRELLDRFPEINMANFGADEVKLLNDWGIEVSMLGGGHERP